MFKQIKNEYDYQFDVPVDGIYVISIEAACQAGKILGLFGGEDLRVEIDNIKFREISPNNKAEYFNIPPAWNGTELKGLAKTVYFILRFSQGKHVIKFIPKRGAVIEKEPEIKPVKDGVILQNVQAQDGDRRPWLTIAIIGLPFEIMDVSATCEKRTKDSDDLKLIIDGKIEKNKESNWWSRNWFWQGRQLKGGTKETRFYENLDNGVHYIEFWADRMPVLNNLKLFIQQDDQDQEKHWLDKWKYLKTYTYKGINNDENYNRYDDRAREAVAYWNEKFFSQKFPPSEPLDPNLVKAMIFQESRMGYDGGNNGDVNVMQVGVYGDPSLDVLNGRAKTSEYEMINGELWKVDYEGKAKVEDVYDSLYWGVRWLYHKAQKIGENKERHWFSWKEAIKRYGPGTQKYADNVWNIYKNGVDSRNNSQIKLWAFSLLALFPMLTFLPGNNLSVSQSIESAIMNTISNPHEKDYVDNIQVDYYKKGSQLFLAVIATQNDWSERLVIGNYENGQIEWIEANEWPTEQSILSARFLELAGFDNPVMEVYGQTHAGHGFFYIYNVQDNKAKLLLKTPAVDINSDIRWAPDNQKEYGYGSCGEVFSGGKLESEYKDLNGDNIADVILNGTEEIICESEAMSDSQEYGEIKVSDKLVKNVFLLRR